MQGDRPSGKKGQMTMRCLGKIMVCMMLTCATSALAQPATQPSGGRERRVEGRSNEGRPPGNGAQRFPGGGRPVREFTPEEWSAASEFMKANSPRRFEAVMKYIDESPSRQDAIYRIKSRLVQRYVQLNSLKSEDPDRYAQILESERTIDEMWGIALKINNDANLSEGDHKRLEADLHQRVAAFVDRMLAKKQQGIDERRKKVDAEQQSLDQEKQQRDDSIERRVHQLLSGQNDFGGFDGGFNGPRRGGSRDNLPPPQPVNEPHAPEPHN